MARFELEALRDFPSEGPVFMLNLVKYREHSLDGQGSGRDAYYRYAQSAGKLIEERGGKVLWAGIIEHPALHEGGDVDWDWSVLVYYPSRAAFVDMVTHPEYEKANLHRENGLEKHVILASRSVVGPLPGPFVENP